MKNRSIMTAVLLLFVAPLLLVSPLSHPPAAAVAVTSSATVWGANNWGQLGDGTTTWRNIPAQLASLGDVTSVAAGAGHSLAAKTDGTVWAWGLNDYGQLGDGTMTNRSTPVQVVGLTDIIEVSAGGRFSVALKVDGTVWAWGRNAEGEIGDGTGYSIDRRLTPVQVPSLTGIIAISAGFKHTLALKPDGTVMGWGSNDYCQVRAELGCPDQFAPALVRDFNGVLNGMIAVSAGGRHSLLLKGDGSVWQIGNNAAFASQILSNVTTIDAGYSHSLAVRTDGTAWGWGENFYGQLGNGTITANPQDTIGPAQVVGLTGVAGVSAGYLFSLAFKSDGTAWGWGYNQAGQLGDGTNSDRWTPVQVVQLSGVTAVSAGGPQPDDGLGHSLAIGEPPPPTVDVAVQRYGIRGPNLPGMCSRLNCVQDKTHTVVVENLSMQPAIVNVSIAVDAVPAGSPPHACTVNGVGAGGTVPVAAAILLGASFAQNIGLVFQCSLISNQFIGQDYVLRAHVESVGTGDLNPANNDLVETQTVK